MSIDNQEQLKKLAKIFQPDNIITSKEIEEVLIGMISVMNSFKKDNEVLTAETKQIANELLNKVVEESNKLSSNVSNETKQIRKDIESKLKQAQEFLNKVKAIKATPGQDGLDGAPADEEKIVAEVLSKLPKYKETILDDAGQIRNKLETLKEEERLDASAIKNLPEFIGKVPNGGGWRNLFQLHDTSIGVPTNNQVLTYDSTLGKWKNATNSGIGTVTSITFVIDGGGSVITTGIKGDLEITFGCVINQVTLLSDQSGSIVVDIWKDTYANYAPTVADTITASAIPTITTNIKSQDATLTGWTTTINAGDILRFNVNSVTSITRLTLSLKVTKT